MIKKAPEDLRKEAKDLLKKAEELERERECKIGRMMMKMYRADLLEKSLKDEIEKVIFGGTGK